MLLSKFRNNNRRINDNTRKPSRSSWAVGVGRHRKARIAPGASNDEDEVKKQKQPTKPKKKMTATTSRRGKSSMTSGRVKRSETKNHPANINVPLGVIAVDVPPLMTQDELHRAKKKCHTTAHRLHKIKRRLLLDIAEEQSMTSEATSHATPSTTALVERSADDQPITTTSNRRPRRGRRNRTASFMPQHQNSDSTMETFFGASSSSFGSSFDDTENAGPGGE